jgi:hypothetical protein
MSFEQACYSVSAPFVSKNIPVKRAVLKIPREFSPRNPFFCYTNHMSIVNLGKSYGIARLFGAAALILMAAFMFIDIAMQPKALHWDFASYYYVGQAVRNGADPYDTQVTSALYGQHLDPYGYNPVTLFPLEFLSRLDYTSASRLFLFLKFLCLVALLFIWKRVFLKDGGGLDFFLLCLLGYNTAIFIDLRCGNVGLFEQLFLWVAFWAFLRRRFVVFCLLIFLVSLIKVQPLFFLGLLLFCEDKRKIFYGLGTLAVFVFLNVVTGIMAPGLFTGYLHRAFVCLQETGIANPSSLDFVRRIIPLFGIDTKTVLSQAVVFVIYGGIVLTVFIFSLKAVIRLKSFEPELRGRWLIFLFCFVFALVCPRFKSYTYILLLVPTYAVIKKTIDLPVAPWLVLFVVLPTIDVRLPFFDIFAYIAADYYPLLVAVGMWILCLRLLFAQTKASGDAGIARVVG